MATDQLSEVFDLVEVRGVMSGGFAVRGRWISRFTMTAPLKLMAVVCGRVRLSADGVDPIELERGDVAILNNRKWVVLEGGIGEGPPTEFVVGESDSFVRIDGAACSDADVIVGGHVDVNPVGEALLVEALAPVSHIRASAAEAGSLHAILDRIVDEVTGNRIGAAFAIQQNGQLLVLDVLRAYIAQTPELSPGWLRVLSDERLRPAMQAMHADPGKPWRLAELASAAAMSRTSFAERFRDVAGVPPLTYLSTWRMHLARRALRDRETSVGALAAELGYASDSAFSTAFKREVGVSPLQYRATL